MNRSDIERILNLQHSAYELLLWLNKRAEHEQELLSDANLEKWRYAETSEEWVRSIYGMFPSNLRPAQEDIPAFARLFSSFFQTSFRLIENAPARVSDDWGEESWASSGKRKLIPGSPAGKKSAKGKVKVEESARELRLFALEELALENDLLLNRAQLDQVVDDEKVSDALTLWTYFHELNRRAQFASQGEAVRSLWKALDEKERQRMSADKVLKARDQLLTSLQTL